MKKAQELYHWYAATGGGVNDDLSIATENGNGDAVWDDEIGDNAKHALLCVIHGRATLDYLLFGI